MKIRHLSLASMFLLPMLAAGCAAMTGQGNAGAVASDAPLVLREMGSFHIGGREVQVSGKPVREVLFTPGGVPGPGAITGTWLA